ncbi:MAG: energy-coupling factor transporter ATPase [Chloroflexota bacterium]|jgi:energy-coupling factor transport system ATP-binding protein
MAAALIEFDQVSYSHPVRGGDPIPALRGISLKIHEGEYVALIGANGSGKTTLARHLNALLLPEQGRVTVNGLDTRDERNHARIRSLVGMVFQTPEDQIVAAVVEEDVAFGPENLGLPPAEIRRRVEESLVVTGLSEHRQRPPHLLSAGQMQRAALAGVLAMRPRCVIFDETTAMLDPGGRRMVRRLINQLHQEGLTVIVISHFMREAVAAERVIVLNRGEIAMDSTPQQVFNHPADLHALGLDLPLAGRLANQMRQVLPDLPPHLLRSRDLLAALPPPPNGAIAVHPQPSPFTRLAAQDAFIEVDDLAHIYLADTPLAHPALRNVNLRAAEKRIHGLIGSTGSGKSTLLQHLNGLLLPQQGRVRVGPFDLNDPATDLKAMRRYAGLVFQNPEYQLFEQYVGDEIAYAPRLKGERETLRQTVRDAMEMVGLDFEAFKDRLTFTLSGGERRKVALASLLAMQPQVLLLDEPAAGLDPRSRNETLRTFHRLAAQQALTLVLSSHHMEDIAELSSSLTVLHKGATLLDGDAEQVYSQVQTLEEHGLEAPIVTRVAARLRDLGWDLPCCILRANDLVEQLRRNLEKHRA